MRSRAERGPPAELLLSAWRYDSPAVTPFFAWIMPSPSLRFLVFWRLSSAYPDLTRVSEVRVTPACILGYRLHEGNRKCCKLGRILAGRTPCCPSRSPRMPCAGPGCYAFRRGASGWLCSVARTGVNSRAIAGKRVLRLLEEPPAARLAGGRRSNGVATRRSETLAAGL